MRHEEFERKLVSMLLNGEHPDLRTLREQFALAKVEKRDWTGTGVFVNYSIPDNCPKTTQKHITLGDVRLVLAGDIPADAILHVKDGRLNSLECLRYSPGEWPREPEIQTLDYQGSNERDPLYLQNQLSA
jgi:hypothetical protein